MHFNSILLFEKYGKDVIFSKARVLEIGPSGYPSEYFKIANVKDSKWDTLDIDETYIGNAVDNPNHIVSKQLYNYPIPNGAYDIVIAGQVIEHVADLWRWLEELKRIVNTKGKIIIICPVSWPYHKAPIDCWRIYPDGFKVLAERVGLELVFSIFESLEKDSINSKTPTYANVSSFTTDYRLPKGIELKISINRMLHNIPLFNKLKFPVSVAYDSIAIFSK